MRWRPKLQRIPLRVRCIASKLLHVPFAGLATLRQDKRKEVQVGPDLGLHPDVGLAHVGDLGPQFCEAMVRGIFKRKALFLGLRIAPRPALLVLL